MTDLRPVQGRPEVGVRVACQHHSLYRTDPFKLFNGQLAVVSGNKPRSQFRADHFMQALVIEWLIIDALEFMYVQYDELVRVITEENVETFDKFAQGTSTEQFQAMKRMELLDAQPVFIGMQAHVESAHAFVKLLNERAILADKPVFRRLQICRIRKVVIQPGVMGSGLDHFTQRQSVNTGCRRHPVFQRVVAHGAFRCR